MVYFIQNRFIYSKKYRRDFEMKKALIILIFVLTLPVLQCRKEIIPGIVEILTIKDLTHNSLVVFSKITDIQDGVGLQYKGICWGKENFPVTDSSSFKGISYQSCLEECMTGMSGLEPDTKYIIRAYFETNCGYVYSDTVIIKTRPIEFFTDQRDGKSYPVKQFGEHIWMLLNLNFSTTGSIFYNNNESFGKLGFGKLYPYAEAITACPPGWHLPSDGEWKELEKCVGVSESDLDKTSTRGSPYGGMMKEPGMRFWESENAKNSNNISGFSILPSGLYNVNKKVFTDPGMYAGFWSVSENLQTAFNRYFYATSDAINRLSSNVAEIKLSVRCVK